MATDVSRDVIDARKCSQVLAGIPHDYHTLAKRILSWIAFSRRPLSVPELVDACSTEWTHDPTFFESTKYDASMVIRSLEPLVQLGSLPDGHRYKYYHRNDECAQLAGETKDYLTSDSAECDLRLNEAEAHFDIAQTCLAYLRRSYLSMRNQDSRYPNPSRHPLVTYTRDHWASHQARAEELLGDGACLGIVEDFLMNDKTRKVLARSSSIANPVDDLGIGNALYWSCYFGFSVTTERLLARGYDVNEVGGKFGTPIQVAAWSGRSSPSKLGRRLGLVQRLLEAGAMVNHVHGYAGTALQAACIQSNNEIAYMLLQAGADVNACGSGDRNPPLTIACQNKQVSLVETLLEQGAKIDALGPYTTSVRTKSSSATLPRPGTGIRDHPEERGHHETALQQAAATGCTNLVKVLLDHGANINAQDGSYGNALRAAIHFGRNEVITLLLDQGADVRILPPHLLVDCNYTIQEAVAKRLFDAGLQSLRRERWNQKDPLKSAVEGEGEIEEEQPDPTLATDHWAHFMHHAMNRNMDGSALTRRLQPYTGEGPDRAF